MCGEVHQCVARLAQNHMRGVDIFACVCERASDRCGSVWAIAVCERASERRVGHLSLCGRLLWERAGDSCCSRRLEPVPIELAAFDMCDGGACVLEEPIHVARLQLTTQGSERSAWRGRRVHGVSLSYSSPATRHAQWQPPAARRVHAWCGRIGYGAWNGVGGECMVHGMAWEESARCIEWRGRIGRCLHTTHL
jgi:hypothetical protein